MTDTLTSFNIIFDKCKQIFESKNKDYGSSWRVLHPSSLTDQILIKAKRVKSILLNKNQKIKDPISDEFIGIINYSLIALIQMKKKYYEEKKIPRFNEIIEDYIFFADTTKGLMESKNHDYGEAWRNMRISSMNDLILSKLLRIKQIEDNQGKTIISEGLEANYQDIVNYSTFALIKLELDKK